MYPSEQNDFRLFGRPGRGLVVYGPRLFPDRSESGGLSFPGALYLPVGKVGKFMVCVCTVEKGDYIAVGKVGIMGKTSLSLPDEMLMELELAADKNGRSFSGEVKFRLIELELMRALREPTGVAKDTVAGTKEYSGKIDGADVRMLSVSDPDFKVQVSDPVNYGGSDNGGGYGGSLGDSEKKSSGTTEGWNMRDGLVGPTVKVDGLPGVDFPVKTVDFGIDSVKDFEKMSKVEKSKKIAMSIPGVVVASEVPEKPYDLHGAIIDSMKPKQDAILKEMVKSAKKRPEITEGRVELIKGFWREEYPSQAAAMIEVATKGWKEGEYQIKPIK